MKTKKYYETVKSNFIDSETGEILDTDVQIKEHKIITASKDQFVFFYASFIGMLKGLNGVEIKLLMYCSLNCSFNTNLIALTGPVKETISKEFDIAHGSIKNAIMRLVKKGILTRAGYATYIVSPEYFWKGEASNRVEALKFKFELEHYEDPAKNSL